MAATSSDKQFWHLNVSHNTTLSPPAIGDEVHKCFLVSADWETDDFSLYAHLISELIKNNPLVSDMPWGFVCGEGNVDKTPLVKKFVKSFGLTNAIVIDGEHSRKDFPEEMLSLYGNVEETDVADDKFVPVAHSDETTPLEEFLTMNGTAAIICTKPPREFLTMTALTDHFNSIPNVYPEYMIDWREHNLYWYASFNARSSADKTKPDGQHMDDVLAWIEKFGMAPFPGEKSRDPKKGNVVIFESHYALSIANSRTIDKPGQTVNTITDPVYHEWLEQNHPEIANVRDTWNRYLLGQQLDRIKDNTERLIVALISAPYREYLVSTQEGDGEGDEYDVYLARKEEGMLALDDRAFSKHVQQLLQNGDDEVLSLMEMITIGGEENIRDALAQITFLCEVILLKNTDGAEMGESFTSLQSLINRIVELEIVQANKTARSQAGRYPRNMNTVKSILDNTHGSAIRQVVLADQLVATALTPSEFHWGYYSLWWDENYFTKIEISEEQREEMMELYSDEYYGEAIGYMGDYREFKVVFDRTKEKNIATFYPKRPDGIKFTSNKVFVLMNVDKEAFVASLMSTS